MNNLTTVAQNAQIWARYSNTSTIIYIVLSFLLLAATAFVSYSSYRSQQYSSLLQSAKDNEIKLVQAASLEKQAASAQEIAVLKTQAAVLNTQSAKLNAEAEKAKEGMAKANAQIADAQNGIAEANRQAQVAVAATAEARVKQEEITHENYKLKIRLEALVEESRAKQRPLEIAQLDSINKIETVSKNQLPRVLTTQQSTRLTDALKNAAGSHLIVNSTLGDAESLGFANQIADTLKSAGWEVDGVNQAIFSQKQVGLGVFVHNGQTSPASAFVLLKALKSVGLDVIGYQDGNISEGVVQLNVGLKPSSPQNHK